jgi:UDP-N-acetylmuramoyl-tripeptide--D-alanyl-D-alanine ligase
MTLKEIAACLGGSMSGPLPEAASSVEALAFSLDSRAITPGTVFVCTKGENSDGHDFAPEAVKKGATAVIAERDPFAGASVDVAPVPVFMVRSSRAAITGLAAQRRERAGRRGVKVVGITGTAGKTSLKEVLATVLSRHACTAKNFMNMNNQWGLPLSILNASEDAAFWVLEAGISEAHDMDELAGLLRPDLALILNVGSGHLSGLGDKGVPYYKSRMLAYLPHRGLALVNADYPELVRASAAYPVRRKFFSTRNTDADFFAAYRGPASSASGNYMVQLVDHEAQAKSAERVQTFEVKAPFRGAFGSENVAAIVGAATLLGLERKEITEGLAEAALPRQRFNCQIFGKTVLIDDSYNSNPLSAARMLESAVEMASENRLPLFLVMGEMFELGEASAAGHLELGKNMAASKARAVVWKGGHEQEIRQGLAQGGFTGEFQTAQNRQEFKLVMRELFKENGSRGVVLFKASRGNRLEEFVEIFQKEFCPDKLGAD